MSRLFMSILAAAVVGSEVAAAQRPGDLVKGQWVRIAYRCRVARSQVLECRKDLPPRVEVGRLRAVEADTVRVRTELPDAELAVPTTSIAELWVAEGKGGEFSWPGAGIGLVPGIVIGAAIGSKLQSDNYLPARGVGGLIGAAGGSLLGGIVGAMIRSDRWRSVPVSGFRVRLEPRREGATLAVGWAF